MMGMASSHDLAKPVRQAQPMTPQFLKDIFYFVHFNDLELVSYTALVLGFYLFLRETESHTRFS